MLMHGLMLPFACPHANCALSLMLIVVWAAFLVAVWAAVVVAVLAAVLVAVWQLGTFKVKDFKDCPKFGIEFSDFNAIFH